MHVYFKSISLENVRCFGKKQTIDFTGKDGKPSMWNLILGENGTGKTTVLKALAAHYLYNLQSTFSESVINEHQFVRNIKIDTLIEIKQEEWSKNIAIPVYNTSKISILAAGIVFWGTSDVNIKSIGVPLFAYGAARHISSAGITNEQRLPVISLFDDNLPLLNAEEWFVQSEYLALKDQSQTNLFARVKQLLLKLFAGEINDIKIETNGSASKKISVLFKTHYGWVPLHQLSLGYKTLIAWMVDFARGLFERYPESANPLAEPAVCLVDEIDLHMHPRFQKKLMLFLSDLFPKTQFIVTAHSPLVAQAAVDMDANIILLSRNGDEIAVENDPVVVKRWRLDQLLASDLFGVTDEKMERRRALLRKAERSADEERELESLEGELKIIPPDSKENDLDREILEYLRQNLRATP